MPQVVRSALLNHSAKAMYDLVNDVLSYPQFLPGCAETKLHESNETSLKASLLIKKAGISQWMTTQNHMIPGERIDLQLVDGPFTRLHGYWLFTPLDESASKVELNLQFEFSNRLVELAFGKIFSALAANMVEAFTLRANEVYR